jgi:class 3 adenylate cyclase
MTSGGKDVDVFGDAPNIASGAQAAADPDRLVITAETQRLVAGRFIVENHGTHLLKGIERPIQLYRLVRASGLRERFEAAVMADILSPFAGRRSSRS